MATTGRDRLVSSQAVGFLSLSALVAQGWDLMVHLPDEIEYLWKARSTVNKAIYLVVRHAMFITQIMNQVLIFYHDKNLSQESWLCSAFYIFKCVVGQTILMLVEIVLFLKVYILYNRSQTASRFIFLVFFTTATLQTIGVGIIIQQASGHTVCGSQKTSHMGMAIAVLFQFLVIASNVLASNIALFRIGAVAFQFLIISTTMAKMMLDDQPTWKLNPFDSLMSREGEVAIVSLIVLSITMMIYECSDDKKIGIANPAFAWYLAFLSIAGSRLILNMGKVPSMIAIRQDPETDSIMFNDEDESSIPLTTFVERM